ncbi:MAG: hypothetical protein ACREMY_33455 [bacterium]
MHGKLVDLEELRPAIPWGGEALFVADLKGLDGAVNSVALPPSNG